MGITTSSVPTWLVMARGMAGMYAERVREWCAGGQKHAYRRATKEPLSGGPSVACRATMTAGPAVLLDIRLEDGTEILLPLLVTSKGARAPVWVQYGSSAPSREVTRRMAALSCWDIPREWDPTWAAVAGTSDAATNVFHLLDDTQIPLGPGNFPGPFWPGRLGQ